MDAFYASVEIRDDPSLKGKPVIVGARPNERGVVATCNYEAREYGVHSAMNVKEAYELCPDGVFIHPDHAKYERVSKQLHEIWDPYSTASEPVALDEAYLDVTETAGTFERAREIAHLIKERTLKEMELTCSVGLSYCMAAAKTASEEMKPDGYYEIQTPDEFVSLMSDRDVRRLFSVGPKTYDKLSALGIEKVSDILDVRNDVERILGQQGRFLVGLAQGIDEREVTPYRPEDAKSISRETTFQRDVSDYMLLMDVLLLMSMDIMEKASRYGLKGTGIILKISYADRRTVTRYANNLVIGGPMDVAHAAWSLLDGSGRSPVRRIGIGIVNLSNEKKRQTTLFPIEDDSSVTEMEHHLKRMHRRYGYDFMSNAKNVLGHDGFHDVVEHMRVQSVKHTRSGSEFWT